MTNTQRAKLIDEPPPVTPAGTTVNRLRASGASFCQRSASAAERRPPSTRAQRGPQLRVSLPGVTARASTGRGEVGRRSPQGDAGPVGATPEFPPALREELIAAEKPRLDPKYFQDTVPPNATAVPTTATAVPTESQPIVTTPRGGFVAPKAPEGAVKRDAPTVFAAPQAKESTPKAARSAAPASVPPVDTSR